jgi:hypothetical protein
MAGFSLRLAAKGGQRQVGGKTGDRKRSIGRAEQAGPAAAVSYQN